MTMSVQKNYEYVYSGTLSLDTPTYTIRKADTELYDGLNNGEFCYVFNSRQTGKSSLRVRTMRRLQNEGITCVEVDLSSEGFSHVTQEQWYAGIIDTLVQKVNLDLDFESWWEEQELLSPVKRFSKFIETVLLVKFLRSNPDKKIVIFLDEIDCVLSLSFSTDEFFTLIRACYNRRADNPIYNQLTFCFLGTTTPSDLIADKTRTPFNIGQAIELTGFTLEEVIPSLGPGLAGKVNNPEIVLQEVLNWTGGQPFLTQKVCNFIIQSTTNPKVNGEAQWVEDIVKSRIIHNWKSQDEPEHLRTILNRILCNEQRIGRLLGIYQRLLLSTAVSTNNQQSLVVVVDESPEQVELRLSGLVVKKNTSLKVYNRIYALIFDCHWVEKELAKLRPYANVLTAWFDSNCQDDLHLLRGKALRDAQNWTTGKSLSDRDYQFLAASEALEKRQTEIAYQQEKRARELEKLEYEINLGTERKNAEAQKQANEILSKATKKANRRIRIGGIILASSLLLSLFGVTQTERYRKTVTAMRLEQEGMNLLLQVPQERNINDLKLAIKTGRELNSLVKPNQSLADYPAYSPVSSLQAILLDICEKNRLEDHKGSVKSVVYSPDGKTLASASKDNTIKLWDATTGKKISTLTGHTDWVNSVVYSPDGKTLASASADNTIKLWGVTTGKEISTLNGHKDFVNSVVYSPDGQVLASASKDGKIKLWNVTTRKEISTLTGHKALIMSIVYSPDGKTLASASTDKTIKLWNVITGKEISTLTGHTNWVNSIVYSPDGKTLASASDDKTIKLWNVDTREEISTITGHKESVNSIVYSRDGKILASASADKTIKLWNVAKGKSIPTLTGHSDYVRSVVYSPDGKTLASASDDKSIKLWDISTGKGISTLAGHNDYVNSVVYSPDGKTLASASNDKSIKLWNVATHKKISTLTGHKDVVMSIFYSPDGKTLASASFDGTIKLWNVTTGQEISTLTGHNHYVNSVVYSPDGKTLASASTDKTIKLWNVATGKEILTLTGHKDRVNSVVYSPDGKTLASASNDNTIKLWNVSTGKEILTLTGHKDSVNSVVYSTDGITLASASRDKTIKLWNLDLDNLLAQGCSWLEDYLATRPDEAKELCPKQ